MWPAENDIGFDCFKFRSVLINAFQLRMKLAQKLVEEIAAGLKYPEFVEKFNVAELAGFYLKKYAERKER